MPSSSGHGRRNAQHGQKRAKNRMVFMQYSIDKIIRSHLLTNWAPPVAAVKHISPEDYLAEKITKACEAIREA